MAVRANFTRRAMLAAPVLSVAPYPASGKERADATIPGAWTRDVAAASGLPYRLFLWRPPGPPPAAGHPVAYLLDGNSVFGTAVDILRLQAEGFGPRRQPPSAIVAIGYPGNRPFDMERRSLDLTPPPAATALPPRPDGLPWPRSGGADDFLAFIDEVVKPLVARELPVDPARQTLFGHSFGGLFALHCLFTRPDSFTTYVAASPSIWWNDRAILATERDFVARGGPGRETRLLLSAGSEEQPKASATEPDARLRLARMVDNARELATRLAGLDRLSTHFHVFEGETHGSVIPASVARGLRFAAEAP